VAAIQVFPNNACAKQKKHLRQGVWKPKVLTIRNNYTRACELNAQLLNFPNQTGALPVNELKSAFISICAPEWQQEFLKTGINECSSTWEEILTKAEALENAKVAVAESKATTNEKRRSLEEGEVAPATQPSQKKNTKPSFCCKLHGANQRHDADDCEVLKGEISKLKEEKSRPSSSFSTKTNNQQKSTWTDRKRQATSYSADQLKEVVCLTKKMFMKQAKENFEAQLRDDLDSMEVDDDKALDGAKMIEMKKFMNNLIAADDSSMEEEPELFQAELEELAGNLSSD
jgi:hypothetical protein